MQLNACACQIKKQLITKINDRMPEQDKGARNLSSHKTAAIDRLSLFRRLRSTGEHCFLVSNLYLEHTFRLYISVVEQILFFYSVNRTCLDLKF